MKLKYIQRLNTKISVIPMLAVMAVLLAGGAVLYFLGQDYLSKDVLGLHVSGITSEKKLATKSVHSKSH